MGHQALVASIRVPHVFEVIGEMQTLFEILLITGPASIHWIAMTMDYYSPREQESNQAQAKIITG